MMSELRRMIVSAENDLRQAKAQASPPGHPRRFIEFDAFAAFVRLDALRAALAAIERQS